MLGKFGRIAAGLVCVLFPHAALAAPVYLSCTITAGNQIDQIKFTLDEQSGEVGIYLPHNGRSVRVSAVYRPEEVSFRDDMAMYVVSRVDLSVVRKIPRFGWVDKGTCAMEKAPKRAF